MILRNLTRANTIAAELAIANSFLTRLQGLLGKKQLDAGCGLLLVPSCGIHTWGMRFSIDVVALSKHLRVLELWPCVRPFRIAGISLRTHSVLELPAGQISHCQISVGDQLELG